MQLFPSVGRFLRGGSDGHEDLRHLWWSHDPHWNVPHLHDVRRDRWMREVMSQTAIEIFYEAIENGDLPAAVPVVTIDGCKTGLAASAQDYRGVQGARDIVESSDPGERAVAALYAIQRTADYVREQDTPVLPVT